MLLVDRKILKNCPNSNKIHAFSPDITIIFYRFRRQHEQLRQVILRVLRPSPSKGRAGTPSTEEPEIQVEPMVDEAADANAIEVNT